MAWHIKRISQLGSAVPTEGACYYTGNGKYSNVFEDRKTFSTKTAAQNEVRITRPFSPDVLPNVEFVKE